MNIYSILPLIATVAFIPLLIIVLSNKPWGKQHLIFSLYLTADIIWSFSSFLMRSDYFIEYKVIIFRVVVCSLIWLVVQWFYFVHYFIHKSAGWGTYLGYACLITVIIGSVLGYIPQGLTTTDGLVSPVLGLWNIPIVVIPNILAVVLVVHLIRKYRKSLDPIERNRIIYLSITVVLFWILSVIHTTPIGEYPTAQIGQCINAALLTYATLKFRIMDMKFLFRRSVIYTAMIAICLCIFTAWLAIISLGFTRGINIGIALGAALLTGITVSFFWTNVYNLINTKVESMMYGVSFDYRQSLSDYIRRGITRVFTLDELCKQLLNILSKVLNSKHIYILLPDLGDKDFSAKYIEPYIKLEMPFVIRNQSPIAKWLVRENRYLFTQNLDLIPEFQGLWQKEKDQIRNLEIEILFPLISRGNLVGILAISKKASGKYSLDETNLVENLSSQIAISIEKEYIQAELRKNEQELSLINRLAAVITSSLNLNEIYDAFVAGLREVIDLDFTAVLMEEEKELILSALYTDVGWTSHVGSRVPTKGTATEWIMKSKKYLYEPDLEHDRMFYTGEEYLNRGIRSILYLPLITKGEVIGSLIVASKRKNAYTNQQIQLMERLAVQVSTSIANVQLYAKAEQRARIDELTGLFNRRHFDESLTQEVNRHSRYGSMLTIAFLDLDNFKNYNDTMGHTAGDRLLSQIGRLIKSSLRNIDQAFRYGGDEFAIIMPHTAVEDAQVVAERIRLRIGSNNGIERAENKILITVSIGLACWPSDGLTPDDLINAVDKALYYAKQTGGNRTCLVSQMLTHSSNEPLQTVSSTEKETLNTIYALSATIEARDQYTYGHSRKVRAYAVALAEALELPAEKVAAISHAALLHDIGKIGVIDEILKKQGKLDELERQSIKFHPQLSKAIVGHVSSLTPCLPAILHHHERWDGNGYPSGLKGEAIPLEARILTIADAFDAMTSLRPYRAPLTYKEAIAELRRCAGFQFDPSLVKKFIPIALTVNVEEQEMMESPRMQEND
jgi:diguanylate cyclase (GGDEF)-like protein